MDCDDWHCAQNPPTPSVGRRTHNLRLCFRKRLDDSLLVVEPWPVELAAGQPLREAPTRAELPTAKLSTVAPPTARLPTAKAPVLGLVVGGAPMGCWVIFQDRVRNARPQHIPVEIIIAVPHAGLHGFATVGAYEASRGQSYCGLHRATLLWRCRRGDGARRPAWPAAVHRLQNSHDDSRNHGACCYRYHQQTSVK